ncbi:hypothetical protein [Intestinibacillus massiliensis]|uniref:hypothetical protein n=1 Tax=Intestinibacillus massiliensis TaxID=1871029 RepID=UPI0013563925|nr:hypothetical protein [Intestinibacillus massiliensis]
MGCKAIRQKGGCGLEASETARDGLRHITETCIARLETALRDEVLGVRDLLAAGKEIRALREALDGLYPAQEFRLVLEVEGA